MSANTITHPTPGQLGRKPVVRAEKARFAEEINKEVNKPKPEPTDFQVQLFLDNLTMAKIFVHKEMVYALIGENVYNISGAPVLAERAARDIIFELSMAMPTQDMFMTSDGAEETSEEPLTIPDFVQEASPEPTPKPEPTPVVDQNETVVMENKSIPAVNNIEANVAGTPEFDMPEAPAFTRFVGTFERTDLEKRLKPQSEETE